MTMLAHGIYILSAAAIASAVPASAFSGGAGIFLTLGVIGLWRYGWALVNFVRAHLYIRVAYPRRRAAAEVTYARRRPAHAFFLVTSYKIDAAITAKVYRSIFEAARRSRGGATVVASVVDLADERLIRAVASQMLKGIDAVELVIDRIDGTGKRDALATSLRSIARRYPTAEDVVLLVDGDTRVPADIVERAAPFFTSPGMGALTTDEAADIEDAPIFRDWFRLRFTQRQMMMSSVALGGRVLTLTGRMSVFRADLATDPDFIAAIEQDHIDHWRLGRVRFLTGDDKSTWYWLLKRGYQMGYLPDVRCVSMETQPKPGFVDSAVTLMRRWFGNMLRTNGRALALSPSQDRLLRLVVDPRPARLDVDDADRPGRHRALLVLRRSADRPRLRRLGDGHPLRLLLAARQLPRALPDQLPVPALFRPALRRRHQDLGAVPPRSAALDPAGDQPQPHRRDRRRPALRLVDLHASARGRPAGGGRHLCHRAAQPLPRSSQLRAPRP